MPSGAAQAAEEILQPALQVTRIALQVLDILRHRCRRTTIALRRFRDALDVLL